jgi:3alpha(or 20beta)-hydroxysteroid dehydrogenase
VTAFAGSSVIVTGAARGMGSAEARLLAAQGADVVVADVLDVAGAELAADIGATYVHLDVRSEADWSAAVAAAESKAPLRGLVNNAGVHRRVNIAEETLAEFRAVVDINLIGAFLGTRAVIEPMRRTGGGAIVNVSSVAGLVGMPERAAYCSSKWALRGLTQSTAIDLGPEIRVNSVHPGPIETAMLTPNQSHAGLPLGRAGVADEVARVVVFLLGEGGAYMTGTALTVDGGATLGLGGGGGRVVRAEA